MHVQGARFVRRALGVAVATLAAAGGALAQQPAPAAAAGGVRVTGRVLTEEGQPLAGATVQIRALEAGAATNSDGVYTINLAAGRGRGQSVALTARYIGFTPQTRTVVLSGTVTADFRLVRDPLRLNQVVVTGVAEATETRKLPFAVGKVDAEVIEQVPALNPASALVGKVAGARVVTPSGLPGAETAVRLRSATSLTPGASQQPLLVVDGIITKGSLADINVLDIESIEVLKGPASAGLYGSDAAAGVIQVITKRGRNVADGRTNITLRNEIGGASIGRRLPLNRSTNCASRVTLPNGLTDFPRDDEGRVDCDDLSIFYDQPYPTAAPFRDQQDQVLSNGLFYTNYLSLGRRQGNTNFQLSFDNTYNAGPVRVPTQDFGGFNRRNVRINVDQFVNEKFDIQAGAFYNSSRNEVFQQGAGSPFFGTLFMPPDVDLRQRNTVGDSALFRANAGILGATPSSDLNPLYQAANQRRNDERERIQGSFRGRFRFTDWLTLEGSYGFDRFGSEFRFFDPRGRLQQNLTEFAGAVNINNVGTTAQNAQAILSATRRTGRLNTILRASVLTEDERNTNQFAGGVNLSAVGVPTLDNTAPQGRQISNFDSRLRARNFFLQGTVDWADKLGLDVLGRRDGSSLFGSDTRWRNFYRVAGFYRLSQDVRIPGIDEFKLRAARGTAGLRPPFFAQYETFTNTNGVISFGVLGSRDLRPAYSTETEVGFNIDFLRRFSLEYTYANKVTQDQVLPVPLSATNGFTTQWRNAGTLEGNTHEALFRTILVDRPGLSWQANITFDRTRQRTTALNSVCFRTGAGSLQANGTNATLQSNDLFFVCPGVDFGAMYGSRWVRSYEELSERPGFDPAANPASNYVVNPDGLLVLASTRGTADERAIRYVNAAGSSNVQIGTSIPDFQLGFNTSFTWKGLSVFGLLDWSQGGNIYNLPRQWLARQEFRSADLDQAGKPQDQRLASAYYAAINDANNFSDYFVEDGSFARLRELSVNYTLTPSQLGFFRLDRVTQRVRLGLIGRNLLTWTRYTGLDPEASAVGTSAGTGAISGQGGLGAAGDATTFRLDNFGYPNFRTFSFLVELGF